MKKMVDGLLEDWNWIDMLVILAVSVAVGIFVTNYAFS